MHGHPYGVCAWIGSGSGCASCVASTNIFILVADIVDCLFRHPLRELLGALEELFPRGARSGRYRHGRHVLLEYVMLRGVNDSLEDAARLLTLTRDIECKVNLICFNAHAGTLFLPSLPAQARHCSLPLILISLLLQTEHHLVDTSACMLVLSCCGPILMTHMNA